MKSKFIIVLTLIILALGVWGYFQAISEVENRGNLPQIEITPKLFDFGEVEYGQLAEYSFQIKNLGENILEIKRVATSCSCTSAEASKKEIGPGEVATLKVSYDTGAMSGPMGRGNQERIIYVKSSDPVSPQVEVKIQAYVK